MTNQLEDILRERIKILYGTIDNLNSIVKSQKERLLIAEERISNLKARIYCMCSPEFRLTIQVKNRHFCHDCGSEIDPLFSLDYDKEENSEII